MKLGIDPETDGCFSSNYLSWNRIVSSNQKWNDGRGKNACRARTKNRHVSASKKRNRGDGATTLTRTDYLCRRSALPLVDRSLATARVVAKFQLNSFATLTSLIYYLSGLAHWYHLSSLMGLSDLFHHFHSNSSCWDVPYHLYLHHHQRLQREKVPINM